MYRTATKMEKKLIDFLLFFYWEIPNELTGFSSSELLYGRRIRGPMKILREIQTGDDNEQDDLRTTYVYVIYIQDKLDSTIKIVQENFEKSSRRDINTIMTGKRNQSTDKVYLYKIIQYKVLIMQQNKQNMLQMPWTICNNR